MMKQNILDTIVAHKKKEIKATRRRMPGKIVLKRALKRRDFRSFYRTLKSRAGRIGIIAEIKRASPSAGRIRADLDAGKQAAAYERGGAAAISVLTDERFFCGNLFDLALAKQSTGLPVLRKDFIISDYQVYESAAVGADAVLLIARILKLSMLKSLLKLTHELGMDALVEVYTKDDIEKVAATDAKIIGINNRNLETFETDVGHAGKLKPECLSDRLIVCASGIRFKSDIEANLKAGIHYFLIGESLVRSDNPAAMIQHLINT